MSLPQVAALAFVASAVACGTATSHERIGETSSKASRTAATNACDEASGKDARGCSEVFASEGRGAVVKNHAETVEPGSSAASLEEPSRATDAEPSHARGPLSKESIRRGIHEGINGVNRCVVEGLERGARLADRANVRFAIEAGGDVKDAAVLGAGSGDGVVDACLLTAVRNFRFPAPKAGEKVVVSYPFIFEFGPAANDAGRK